MKEILHKELSYKITGLCFQIQKEQSRFCREKQYADRFEELLKENKINYEREFDIIDAQSKKATGNRVDFLIENKIIVDLKAKNFVNKDDYFQMQRYLRSLDLELGMIINFRSAHLKPKRVLNSDNMNYKKSKKFQFGAFGLNSTYSDRPKGFSLMELMIVIAIIGVMTSVGLVSLNYSKTARALENASREVAAAVREAQNNALSGRQPDADQTSCGHGFYFDRSENDSRYFIYDNYVSTGETSCADVTRKRYTVADSNISSTYTLKDGVVFRSEKIDLYFESPHAAAYSGGEDFNTGTKTIILEKKEQESYVCVYADGNVIENGSLSTCP